MAEADVDFDMVAPLKPEGTNFPCKGYLKDLDTPAGGSTKTYTAGQQTTFKTEGVEAAHNGGSCQVSLSFDQGKTWKVIKSFIGNCVRSAGGNTFDPNQEYSFTIPAEAKSGDALWAWTWFNQTGNREMYMNCAHITIQGSGTSTLDDLPDMFVANVNNGLKTEENKDLEFPDPGKDVERNPATNGAATAPPERAGDTDAPVPDAPVPGAGDPPSPGKDAPALPAPSVGDPPALSEDAPAAPATSDLPAPSEDAPAALAPSDPPAPGEDAPAALAPSDLPAPGEDAPAALTPSDPPAPGEDAPAAPAPSDLPAPSEDAPAAHAPNDLPAPGEDVPATSAPSAGDPPAPGEDAPAPPAGGRTHTVAPGEFCISIAQANHISLKALLAANPDVDPECTTLQVGQTLNLRRRSRIMREIA